MVILFLKESIFLRKKKKVGKKDLKKYIRKIYYQNKKDIHIALSNLYPWCLAKNHPKDCMLLE